MGLFGTIFKGQTNNSESTFPWIKLSAMAQLDELAEKSATKAQVIFKHSTSCGISSMVLRQFTNTHAAIDGQLDFYFLDLHAHRHISNEVAHRFQVIHQSPQLLIIKNDVATFHTSHAAIPGVDLGQFVR